MKTFAVVWNHFVLCYVHGKGVESYGLKVMSLCVKVTRGVFVMLNLDCQQNRIKSLCKQVRGQASERFSLH